MEKLVLLEINFNIHKGEQHMTTICIFNLNNKQKDYAACLQFIKLIEEKKSTDCKSQLEKITKIIDVSIGSVKANFSPRYLEEPMNLSEKGRKEKSQVLNKHTFAKDDINYLLSSNRQVRYHLRIHFGEKSVKESDEWSSGEFINLQYLAMLLKRLDILLLSEYGNKRRLTVFMVPYTGELYPFSNSVGEVDFDTYINTSHYLRLLSKRYTGVIYGVKCEKNRTLVSSLDFHHVKQYKNFFPLLLINAEKYEQLFSYPINDKLEELFSLQTNRRFRNANHEDPNIAMQDFVAETSVKRIKNVLRQNISDSLEVEKMKSVIYQVLRNTPNLCLMHFALFAFLLYINEKSYQNFRNLCKNLCNTSNELTQGIKQIIQNAIQHTVRQECFFSFYLHTKKKEEEINVFHNRIAVRFPNTVFDRKRDEALEVIISDLNESEDLIENFTSNLENELNEYKKYHNEKRELKGHVELIMNTNRIHLRNFFSEFGDSDAKDEWLHFRRDDLIAHIGLSQFSLVAKKCGASVKVISTKEYILADKRKFFYKAYSDVNESGTSINSIYDDNKNVIPGTQFSILFPVGISQKLGPIGIGQLNQSNQVNEDYESYAIYLEYEEKREKIIVNKGFTEQENSILNAKSKFGLVQLWTIYWKRKLSQYIDMLLEKLESNKFSKYVINYDFSEAVGIEYFYDYDRIEVCLKGIIGALEEISDKGVLLYIAMTNLPEGFIEAFRRICVQFSVKKFPKNLQLCLQEQCNIGQPIKRIIMLGKDFAQAIENSYVLSIEHGVVGFEKSECKYAAELKDVLSFNNYNDENIDEGMRVMPFDVILHCSEKDKITLFEKQLREMAEGALDEAIIGYKLNDTHMRLGSKVHIESFYEMSFLFYRTAIANRIAFLLLRYLLEKSMDQCGNIDLKNDSLLFYGYASYSKAILTSVTEILEEYRRVLCENGSIGAKSRVAFASFQHNLMLESEETQMYFGLPSERFPGKIDEDNRLQLEENVKIIQIVPISSTLTTFNKMWRKFVSSVSNKSKGKVSIAVNYTVFWVVDNNGKILENCVLPSEIEKRYWKKVKNYDIETKLASLKNAGNNSIHYLIKSEVVWHDPLKCKLCYPEFVINEVPLVETDPTSTVPTQQIRYKKVGKDKPIIITNELCAKFLKLKDCVAYGHICRRKNHYQFYIDTQKYFYNVKSMVRSWLLEIKKLDKGVDIPTLHIIFSPEHNTNVGFAQYVNMYYFKGFAEIVSINVDKQFRSNFVCEHAALKRMIDELYQNKEESEYQPVKFYFVDDTIVTGETLQKANGLLQSLLPENTYSTNVFSKIFVLVDRLSDDTKKNYVNDSGENFLSFLHIDVSNTRSHGDSCIGCKLEQSAEKMFKRSATKSMASYWMKKRYSYEKKEYDNREKMVNMYGEESYQMFIFSHVMQNALIKQKNFSKMGDAYDVILNISSWILDNEANKDRNAYGFEKLLIEEKGLNGVQALLKTICRPFISYDFTIKRQCYTFMILLSELFIGEKIDNIVPECLQNTGHIDFLYAKNKQRVKEIEKLVEHLQQHLEINKKNKLVFFQKYILKGLTDLSSTYIMRKSTIKKIYMYIKNLGGEITEEIKSVFWDAYAADIYRLVSNNSDETKELWLEYLYMTGKEYDDFEKDFLESDKKSFMPQSLYSVITGNSNVAKEDKQFYQFCYELFLQNTGINFDNLEKNVNETKLLYHEKGAESDEKDYWRQMRCLTQYENPFSKNNKKELYIQYEEALFSFLSNKNKENSQTGVHSVNKWYQELLKLITNVICNKFSIKEREINIALLTDTMNERTSTDHIQRIDIVEERINSSKISSPETKYCMKNRVVQALENRGCFELEKKGYFVSEDTEVIEGQRRPYIIVFFDNSVSEMPGRDHNVMIGRVFLYISIEQQNPKWKTSSILGLILREIMTYRNRIQRYLQKDFAGDIYARYARKNGEKNILSHEKSHSHNTTADDAILLEVFVDKERFHQNYSVLSFEEAKDWLLLRNYTNGQIAKIFNRSFHEEQDENLQIANGPLLYIPSSKEEDELEPFSQKMDIFSKLNLKYQSPDNKDERFKLLNSIIDIQYDSKLEQAKFIQGENNEFYNLEYFRCIMIDMLISAIKFQSTRPDFLLRIDRLLEVQKQLELVESEEYKWIRDDIELQKLFNRMEKEKCRVQIFRQKSEDDNIDYLIVRNQVNTTLYKMDDWEKLNESIKHRLQDPLDFVDGHMSLLAIKRYIENLLPDNKLECVFRYFKYSNKEGKDTFYFENRLPVLKKE